jgi:hypothetical protein
MTPKYAVRRPSTVLILEQRTVLGPPTFGSSGTVLRPRVPLGRPRLSRNSTRAMWSGTGPPQPCEPVPFRAANLSPTKYAGHFGMSRTRVAVGRMLEVSSRARDSYGAICRGAILQHSAYRIGGKTVANLNEGCPIDPPSQEEGFSDLGT